MQTLPSQSPEALAENISRIGDGVIERLRTVYDPEIPVNIFDLGLIYKVDISPKENNLFVITIDMTLTTPNCPVAGQMPAMVQQAASGIADVTEVNVNLIWDPPWDKSRMSDEARMQLNMF